MSGFLGMFGKKSEVPAPPSGMKPPVPRPAGVGSPPPVADFPSSIMGLKAPKPMGNKIAKSTQRIVLPAQKTGPIGAPSIRPVSLGTQNTLEPTMRIMVPGKIQGTAAALSSGLVSNQGEQEKISLPLSIALRSLPSSVLSDQAKALGSTTDEFLIPVDLVVPQLSVGKIEFTVRQMMEFLPATIFKPSEEIVALKDLKVVLPMMEVFTRISAQKNKSNALVAEAIIEDKNKTRPLDLPIIPPTPPAPPAPLIPSFVGSAPKEEVEHNLEDLLAAAQNALGDQEIGEKTIANPPSVEEVLIAQTSVDLIPPPPIVVPKIEAPLKADDLPLGALLQAAQAALEEVPVGDQTVVVPELQEERLVVPEPAFPAPTLEPLKSTEIEGSKPAAINVEVVPSIVASTQEVSSEVELDLNRCDEATLMKAVRCSLEIAKSVISYRQQCGGFSKLETLLLVPGMTDRVYRSITSQHASVGRLLGMNELLNIDSELKTTEEQAVARIALWPGIRGCLVVKESHRMGSLIGVEDLESFIAHARECLKVAKKLISSELLVHQLLLNDSVGSWIILQRGETLVISGFQGGMIPDSMRFVLEKLTIEFHEVVGA